MSIPTEPIGSIPRPEYLLQAMADLAEGKADQEGLDKLAEQALAETIERLKAAGSTVVTDGEQTKPSFATYPLTGVGDLSPDGVVIPFADGHTRQLPKLTAGPFRYGTYAVQYLKASLALANGPVKQAVIAPSALSLLYPEGGILGYTREQFLSDLADEAEKDIRQCLDAGADSVQLDFTEGRLSLKLDPSGGILDDFIALNNLVLERFSDEERARIGVHTCPGGDQDSVHSLDVDYAGLLPKLFTLKAGRIYLQLASEQDPERVLRIVAENARDDQRVFVGVIDPISPEVETAEQVRDRVLAAAAVIGVERLGTCDDCGFAPFADDLSTPRDTAFAKVEARVRGTELAAKELGV